MAEEIDVGCARPTGGPVGEDVSIENKEPETIAKETSSMIQVREKSTGFYRSGISKRKVYFSQAF